MQSNGGMSTFGGAARTAVTTVLSGPAGGVTAGVAACRMTGFPNIITFDMGGTSCDVALIKDGEPIFASRGKIEGRDIAVPMMDINTVSAGGGTIAKVDRFGVLEVGPHSAGAVPGPACYGRGGAAATITDCNLVLGYLSAGNFLGGRMKLDRAKAGEAVARVAKPLSLDVAAAAEGIVRIIEVKMEEAIKAISTMRGHDLRDFMLLAFGGAGPCMPRRMARDLGMAGVIVPLYPGVFSALGLLMSDVKHDYIRSRMTPISALTPDDVNALFAQMETQARDDLRRDGFADSESASSARSTCATPARATKSRWPARRRDHGTRRIAQGLRCRAQGFVRPHGARGAGRGRLLSRARRRHRAGRRHAEIQAARPYAVRRIDRNAKRAFRRRHRAMSGLSARKARCRA